jgi:uncharacterized protein
MQTKTRFGGSFFELCYGLNHQEPSMEEMQTQVMYVLAIVMILIGLVGTVLPALPGLPLMFCGMLLGAWAGDFKEIGVWTIVLLAVLMIISVGVDFLATMMGAKRVGASKKAMIGAAIGTFAGLFFGIPGLLLGPFIGAVVGEMIDGKEWRLATKTGFGTWLGLAIGTALKLALAVAMLGIFIIALVV